MCVGHYFSMCMSHLSILLDNEGCFYVNVEVYHLKNLELNGEIIEMFSYEVY